VIFHTAWSHRVLTNDKISFNEWYNCAKLMFRYEANAKTLQPPTSKHNTVLHFSWSESMCEWSSGHSADTGHRWINVRTKKNRRSVWKIYLSGKLFTKKPTWIALRANPDLRVEKTATNCLRYRRPKACHLWKTRTALSVTSLVALLMF
jgi:hypothetical protein